MFAAFAAGTILGIGPTAPDALIDAMDDVDSIRNAAMTPVLEALVKRGVADAFRLLPDGRLGTVEEASGATCKGYER
jgi:hypothetical protein